MTPTLQRLFVEYADAHQHPTNQLTHKIAIPLIVFHIIAMLDWVKLFTLPFAGGVAITLGILGWLVASGWYLAMDVKLGVLMTVLFAACIPLGRLTPWWLVVAAAVVGWLIQLAGHLVWEKRSPAFLTNLVQALVGPMFFVAKLTGAWPRASAAVIASKP